MSHAFIYLFLGIPRLVGASVHGYGRWQTDKNEKFGVFFQQLHYTFFLFDGRMADDNKEWMNAIESEWREIIRRENRVMVCRYYFIALHYYHASCQPLLSVICGAVRLCFSSLPLSNTVQPHRNNPIGILFFEYNHSKKDCYDKDNKQLARDHQRSIFYRRKKVYS